MHAIKTATLCLLTALGFSASAATDCEALDHKASENGIRIQGYMAIHKVVGHDKLQFYSAPDLTCKLPGVFILPAESVFAYVTYGEFTAVMYVHPTTKEDTEGWVLGKRLKATGYGIAPKQ
jgi:hypothetical protein